MTQRQLAPSRPEFLGGHRLVPVVSLRSAAEAHPIAQALTDGGLPLAEVTLRTPDALDGLRAMAELPGITVGAGSVRTPEQVEEAAKAGARFLVSPCLTRALAAAAAGSGLPFIPGVATATEIQKATDLGFTTVKFFPAEASGGIRALRSLAEPFPEVTFLPTGGISAVTATGYLAFDRVLAVGGSWMLPAAARQAGDWEVVTSSVAAAVRQVEHPEGPR